MAEKESTHKSGGGQILTGIGVGLAVAAALYAGAWYVSANMLRTGVEKWLDARRAEGFTVKTGALATAGFPSRIAVRIPDVDFAAPRARGRWTWRTPAVEVNASPLRLDHIDINLTGSHHLTGPWIEAPALELTATKAGLALTVKDGQLTEAQLNLEDGAGGWNAAESRVHMDKAGVLMSLAPEAPPPAPASGKAGGPLPAVTARLAVKIDNLTIPGQMPAPLTNTVGEIAFNAEVVGPVGDGALPKLLAAWSNAGGAVNVKDFSLQWAPLGFSGEGSIALDQDLQPMGAFTTRLAGFTDGLDIMVREHRMAKNEAAVAKGMLGLMAKPGANGQAEISVPLTVQDRILSAGPLKLFEVPRVDWPGGAPP